MPEKQIILVLDGDVSARDAMEREMTVALFSIAAKYRKSASVIIQQSAEGEDAEVLRNEALYMIECCDYPVEIFEGCPVIITQNDDGYTSGRVQAWIHVEIEADIEE